MGLFWDEHLALAIYLYLGIIIVTLMWLLFVLTSPKDATYRQGGGWTYDLIFSLLLIFVTWINYNQAVPDWPIIGNIPRPAFQKIIPYIFFPYFATVFYRALQQINK